MRLSALPRAVAALLGVSLLWGAALPDSIASAQVTALSPDQRPTLVIVTPADELMLVHHAQPLSPSTAERLALKLGLFIAGPIIRSHARESVDPLPQSWRTAQPDRGFGSELTQALDHTQANWPWRGLRMVSSPAQVAGTLNELKGQDVAVVTLSCELLDLTHSVQFSAETHVRLLRRVATAHESRTDIVIRHLAAPLRAERQHAQSFASTFGAGGPLDRMVNDAALDLSRALAVTIARIATPAPEVQVVGRRLADLPLKPKCAECRPTDTVLHEEPGRIWVAPSRSAGTILSLPVG